MAVRTTQQALALEVGGLSLSLTNGNRPVPILDDVSFAVGAGEIVGLVGESGSGKTMTAMAIADLLPGGSSVSGRILVQGRDLLAMDTATRQSLRGSSIAMVFQDPVSALNPVFTVRKQIGSLLRVHQNLRGRPARAATEALLRRVGLRDPVGVMQAYPHQLSGGMCQRVMIAMALACQPRVLIADEPTTALDVTVQAEIVALLTDLVAQSGLSVLFISHDLGLVSQLCHSVVVMYAGQVIESGPTTAILRNPSHPYSRALMECVPDLDAVGVIRPGIAGRAPEAGQVPDGCRFAPRCTFAAPGCERDQILEPIGPQQLVRCWRHPGAAAETSAAGQAAHN